MHVAMHMHTHTGSCGYAALYPAGADGSAWLLLLGLRLLPYSCFLGKMT